MDRNKIKVNFCDSSSLYIWSFPRRQGPLLQKHDAAEMFAPWGEMPVVYGVGNFLLICCY